MTQNRLGAIDVQYLRIFVRFDKKGVREKGLSIDISQVEDEKASGQPVPYHSQRLH